MHRFNFDEMLDLAGNTAVFLLYMHARIASIDSKAVARTRDNGSATLSIEELKRSATLALTHDKEARVCLSIQGLHMQVRASRATLGTQELTCSPMLARASN